MHDIGTIVALNERAVAKHNEKLVQEWREHAEQQRRLSARLGRVQYLVLNEGYEFRDALQIVERE